MAKNRKHTAEFKLDIIKYHQRGDSVQSLSKKWDLSRSLIRKWIDLHSLKGAAGLLSKSRVYHTRGFKLKVVKTYRDKRLSLRDCCLQFNIPAQSTVLSWLRKYEQLGPDGLNEQKGRPRIMKKAKLVSKKVKPLTPLQELEQENLYLRAEIAFLKKLEALTLEKQTQLKKKR